MKLQTGERKVKEPFLVTVLPFCITQALISVRITYY
jgi:hypothetical protein